MKNSLMITKSILRELLGRCGDLAVLAGGDDSVEITSIEYNSSRVRPGALFCAVEGFASDGHAYLVDAVDRGAAAVVVSRARINEFSYLTDRTAVVVAGNTRKALSRISSEFYNRPSSRIPVIGITGTNGKTSVTYMLEMIFSRFGYSPGIIGTVNYRWQGKEVEAPNTTPESRDLQELVAVMVRDGVSLIVMEVSSHGLKLNRVDDIEFDTGIFTNLTRDHLDFHSDFDDYFLSKRVLFERLEDSCKSGRHAIINIDDSYGNRILSDKGRYSYPFLSYGCADGADYRPQPNSIVSTIEGIKYRLEKPHAGTDISLNLSGNFNVSNSLCAFAAAHSMGIPVGIIQKGFSSIDSIPGRFDRITSNNGFNVIVDYAHTSDALEKLLLSSRDICEGRLITVFGCGGDRDKTKRPLMGKAASDISDHVIITSDNPRTEDPDAIISDILSGIEQDNYEVEPDREKAIAQAIKLALKNDIIVVAGKGHEDYQIIGKEKHHFDDREIVKKYLEPGAQL